MTNQLAHGHREATAIAVFVSYKRFACARNNLFSRVPPCFGRNVKPLVPDEFAVVSTHQPALGLRGGLWPVILVGNP
jgi:hypothetical protein